MQMKFLHENFRSVLLDFCKVPYYSLIGEPRIKDRKLNSFKSLEKAGLTSTLCSYPSGQSSDIIEGIVSEAMKSE